jgi:hypothetical protein
MPRTRKPPGTAADPRNGQRTDLSVVGPSQSQVKRFPAPRGLSAPAKTAWSDFWDDRPALLLTPSSKVVLLRWIAALDRQLRALAIADANPLVEGSTGQLVMNPAYRIAEQARTLVEACEKQLGIGGVNAAALGLAAITERRSLADLNARYGQPEGGDHDRGDGDGDDPRIRIVDVG